MTTRENTREHAQAKEAPVSKEDRIKSLLERYEHAMLSAAPRTPAELDELREVLTGVTREQLDKEAADKAAAEKEAAEKAPPVQPLYNPMYERKPTEAEIIKEKVAKKAAEELAARKAAAQKAAIDQARAAEQAAEKAEA
jgi:colicin import membrane protein